MALVFGSAEARAVREKDKSLRWRSEVEARMEAEGKRVYHVTVKKIVEVVYSIAADNPDDAAELVLDGEGDEVQQIEYGDTVTRIEERD